MPFVRRITFVVLNACLMVTGSEMLFWARPLDALTWPGIVLTILVYSWLVYLFLASIAYFRISSFPALFLAGAFYGWLDEGVLVQTVYAPLPLSIAWTGLAWHALLVICVLWYGLQKRLLDGTPWRLVRWCLGIGFGFGLWAVTWWTESGLVPTPIATFAMYSFATISFFGGAAWLASRVAPRTFTPSRLEIIILAGGMVLYFAVITVPRVPVAIIILPLLLAPIFVALRRNRRKAMHPDTLALMAAAGPIPVYRLPILWLIPLTATLIYASLSVAHLIVPTSIIVYLITVPLGFGLFIWSVVHILKFRPPLEKGVVGVGDRIPDKPPDTTASPVQP